MPGTSGAPAFISPRIGKQSWHVEYNIPVTVVVNTNNHPPTGSVHGGPNFGVGVQSLYLAGLGIQVWYEMNTSSSGTITYTAHAQIGGVTLTPLTRVWSFTGSGSGIFTATDLLHVSLDISLDWQEWKYVLPVDDQGLALPEDKLIYFQTPLDSTGRTDGRGVYSYNYTFTSDGNVANGGSPAVFSGSGVITSNPMVDGIGFQLWTNAVIGQGFQHKPTAFSNIASGLSVSAKITKSRVTDTQAPSPGYYDLNLTATGSQGGSSIAGTFGVLTLTVLNATAGADARSDLPILVRYDVLVTRLFLPNLGADLLLHCHIRMQPSQNITAINGLFQAAQNFQQHSCTSGAIPMIAIGTYQPPPDVFYFQMDAGAAAVLDIPSEDQVLHLKDDELAYWAVTTLSHAASVTIDGFSSVAGWAGTNATVALAAPNGLQITGTAGSASAKKTNYATDFRNYRTLRIRAKSNNSRTITLTLGTKTYTFAMTGGAGYANFDIDLCAGLTNPANPTDDTDTSWTDTEAVRGDYYGVQQVAIIEFSGLANGDILTIDSLKLVQAYGSFPGTVCCESVQSAHIDDWFPLASPPNYNRYHRGLWDLTDGLVLGVGSGKQGLDLPFSVRAGTMMTPAPNTPNRIQSTRQGDALDERLSLDELITLANTSPPQVGLAMTASATGLSNPGYYNGALYAAYLTDTEFAGLADDTRVGVQDKDFTSKALIAWPEYIYIGLYPGITNPGGHTSNGYPATTFPLRLTKRVNACAHGLVVDTMQHTAKAGQVVSLTDGFGTIEVTTDPHGYYRFPPRKPGDGAIITVESHTVSRNLIDRKWSWAGFGAVAQGAYKAIEADHPRQWLHIGVGKKIATYNLVDFSLAFLSADHPPDSWVKFRVDTRRSGMACLGVIGATDFRVYFTQDGGLSLTEVLDLTANSALIEQDSVRGLMLSFWGDASNKIWKQESSDPALAVWGAPTAVLYNGSQLTATLLDITQDDRRNDILVMTCIIGGDAKVLSSDHIGDDWELRLS